MIPQISFGKSAFGKLPLSQLSGNLDRGDNFQASIGFAVCSPSMLRSREIGAMRIPRRVLFLLLVSLLGVSLAGCPSRESISKINHDPARFAGKEISVMGQVTDSFGAAGTGVFQIDDGTGTMWVFSKGYGVPGSGGKVAVTGVIQQGFAFGGRNFATILLETKPRH